MARVVKLEISAQHPAFPGHFPGAPILPGVVLLDEILRAVVAGGNCSAGGPYRIGTAKFHSVVRPGESLTLEQEDAANGTIHFRVRAADRTVASGALVAPEG